LIRTRSDLFVVKVERFTAGSKGWATTGDALKEFTKGTVGVSIDSVIHACNTVTDMSSDFDGLRSDVTDFLDGRSDMSEYFSGGCGEFVEQAHIVLSYT